MISVLGVVSASLLKARDRRGLLRAGKSRAELQALILENVDPTNPTGGSSVVSLLFVVFTLAVGLGNLPCNEEIVFVGSFAIVSFLIERLTRELGPEARATGGRC